jgi:hypothetical protein
MSGLPDFAIVGEPKSGTTALAEFLGGHPGICMSVPKETAYFATDLREESDRFHGAAKYFEFRTEDDYAAAFAHCEPGQLRGDASTAYLHSQAAAANLHDANPAARIVVMLREPVSFLHALHTQFVNETTEDEPDFPRALDLEAERRAGRSIPPRVRCPSFLFYRERARYSAQVERFWAVFPRDQILVLVFEEFRADNEGHYQRVLEFLGADPSYAPEFREVHASSAPRSRRLNRALNTPAVKRSLFRALGSRRYDALRGRVAGATMKRADRGEIPPSIERELREELRPEVDRVSELVDRDLRSLWGS